MAVQMKNSTTQLLGNVPFGTLVKCNINGQPTQLRVLHQGNPDPSLYDASCDGTWVCLENIYSKRRWGGSNNDLKNSDIQAWMNGDFLNMFDPNIRDAIKQVKIPYVNGTGGSAVASGANGLSCKIFLLSGYEVGFTTDTASISLPEDGAKLDCFQSGTSSAANQNRIANYNGLSAIWWTRSPQKSYNERVWCVGFNGNFDYNWNCYDTQGMRPVFILPQDLFVLEDGTIIANQPPTAPASIDVSGVVRGGSATITLTAATDPDGTVESYIFERQVDGGAWQQVAQVNSLTQTDTIGEDWGTVAYRACAVDDLGVSGPYVTSETYTVTSGLVTIAGPAADLGEKPMPFPFWFSCGVSDQTAVQDIAVRVTVDGKDFFTGTLDSGTAKGLYIDTRFRGAGQHTIAVTASKEDYQPAAASYTFTVPSVTLPYEGRAEMPQNAAGQPVWWYGLARFIFGPDGKDLITLMQEMQAASPRMVTGSYQGTGQSGSSNPNKIVCGFRPKMAVVIAGTAAGLGESTGILWVGSDTVGSKHITVDDTSFAWYSETSADNQLNTSGSTYYYLIAG